MCHSVVIVIKRKSEKLLLMLFQIICHYYKKDLSIFEYLMSVNSVLGNNKF